MHSKAQSLAFIKGSQNPHNPRHPFANAFSAGRMAVEEFNVRKLPAQEFEERLRVGERGIAAQENNGYARN